MKFWDERNNLNIYHEVIDNGIIDLFSLLDNKIGQFLQKWDRSTLIMVNIFYQLCNKKVLIRIKCKFYKTIVMSEMIC